MLHDDGDIYILDHTPIGAANFADLFLVDIENSTLLCEGRLLTYRLKEDDLIIGIPL